MDIEDYYSQNTSTLTDSQKEELRLFIKDLCVHDDLTNKSLEKYIRVFGKINKWSPRKSDILEQYLYMIDYDLPENDSVRTILIKKKSNSLSGIVTVTIMAKSLPIYRTEDGTIKVQNFTCKHDCWFCPDERITVLEFIETIYEKYQISFQKTCLVGLFLLSSRAEEIFGLMSEPNIYETTKMDRLLCSFVGKIIVCHCLGDNIIQIDEYDWFTLANYIKMMKDIDINPVTKDFDTFMTYIFNNFNTCINRLFKHFSNIYDQNNGYESIFDNFNEMIQSKNKKYRCIKEDERVVLRQLFDTKPPTTFTELLNEIDVNVFNAEGLLPRAAEIKYEENDIDERKDDIIPFEWNCKNVQSFNMQITRFVMGYPRSYLSNEPAVMRAEMNRHDHVLQFCNRIESLRRNGHPTEKVEAKIIGGTVSQYPRPYIIDLATDIYYAGNTFRNRQGIPRQRMSLEEEMKENETASIKIIGLTIETRPDSIVKDPEGEMLLFRRIGCTRIEIGIQHVINSILKGINRGHSIRSVYKCMEILKYNGFKVCGHFMHGLPGATIDNDMTMNDEIATNPYLQVDEIKVYPYSVVPYSKFYDEKDTLNLHNKEELYNLIKDLMTRLNYWQREDRVVRDIPSHHIHGGCDNPSMGQTLNEDDINRRSIRHREVKDDIVTDPVLKVRTYQDTSGISYWLSFESKDETKLYSMLRLFFPMKIDVYQQEVLKGSALVREIHTYGKLRTTTNKNVRYGHQYNKSQHMGFGSLLLKKAEEMAYIEGYRRMAIISGNSVRNYYRKRGYHLDRTYMVKELKNTHNNQYIDNTLCLMIVLCCLFFGFAIGFGLIRKH